VNTATPTPSVSPSADATAAPTPTPTPTEPEPTQTVTLQPVSNDDTVQAIHDLQGTVTLLGVLLLFVAGVLAVKALW